MGCTGSRRKMAILHGKATALRGLHASSTSAAIAAGRKAKTVRRSSGEAGHRFLSVSLRESSFSKQDRCRFIGALQDVVMSFCRHRNDPLGKGRGSNDEDLSIGKRASSHLFIARWGLQSWRTYPTKPLISLSSKASPHGGISLLSPTEAPPPLIVLQTRSFDSFAIRVQSLHFRTLVA